MEGEEEESCRDGHETGGEPKSCARECEEEEEVEREDCFWGRHPLEDGKVVHRAGDERSEGGGEDACVTVELCHIAPLHEEIDECSEAPCNAHESKT